MGRDVIPGFRFFQCDDCGLKWKEQCRDAQTPSMRYCPNVNDDDHPDTHGGGPSPCGYELHPEWPTDEFGNLLREPGTNYGVAEYWNGKFEGED